MEQYQVIKTIVEGFTIYSPQRYSKKVVAKTGTILIAERDYKRLGAVTVLRKKNGRYVCDLGSLTANEHCVKL